MFLKSEQGRFWEQESESIDVNWVNASEIGTGQFFPSWILWMLMRETLNIDIHCDVVRGTPLKCLSEIC